MDSNLDNTAHSDVKAKSHLEAILSRSAEAHDMLVLFDKVAKANCGVKTGTDEYSIGFTEPAEDIERPENIGDTLFNLASLLGAITPQVSYTPEASWCEDDKGRQLLRLELILKSQDPNLELNDESVTNIVNTISGDMMRERFTSQVYAFYKQNSATSGRVIQ